MRFIPSFLHGLLDYIFGILLALSPWLLGLDYSRTATQLAVILGSLIVLYSVFTNYEAGAIRIIPFRVHLLIDLFIGLFLIFTPSLFGFPDRFGQPFVFYGIYATCVALLTNPRVYGLDRFLHGHY